MVEPTRGEVKNYDYKVIPEPTNGDGIVRNYQYAVWRDDKEPTQGYSRELVNKNLKKEYWEDLSLRPRYNNKLRTFLDYFEY